MKRITVYQVAAALLSCAVCVPPVTAKTWHVPGDAPTIAGGISLASSGDTVLVGCGTYYEYDIRMKSGVCLRSATGDAGCVTIDAQQQDRAVYCRFMASTTRIEGFTITGGHVESAPPVQGNGGGLYCLDTSRPSVKDCIFTGNSATNGGGVYCGVNSSATFIDCTITGNSATNGGSGLCFQDNSNPTMTDCTVSGNDGTGIWTTSSAAPTLTNCTFSGNTKGGVYCGYGSGSMTLTDCTFSFNTSGSGGGMKLWNSSATLTNCTFSNNTALSEGGGIYLVDATVTLVNCSFSGNSADDGGGIFLENSAQGASYLAADTTEFLNNTASAGAHGFVGSGSVAILTCSVPDLSGFVGGGTITLYYDGCFTAAQPTTWGRLKTLYR